MMRGSSKIQLSGNKKLTPRYRQYSLTHPVEEYCTSYDLNYSKK
jgi:hypothetical protein